MQTNPVVRRIALNGDAGDFVVIRCSITCGYMEISEAGVSDGGAAAGLEGNYLDPFTAAPNPAAGVAVWEPSSATYPVGDYPIAIGDPRHDHGAQFMPIGNGGSGTYRDSRSPTPQPCPAGPGYQNPSLGTPIIQLRGATAASTIAIVKEWA